jgi:hypothetical protein
LPQEDLWFDPVNTARQTRSWYRYQDECVAYRCIPNLIEGSIDRIVVEWATDYVVIAKDGSVELVSVKHRGANTSPWTLGQLARERVLTDLHRVWTHFKKTGRYGFESSQGFHGREARTLLDACTRRAKDTAQQALEQDLRVYGPGHPEVMEDTRLLASLFYLSGDVKSAHAVLHSMGRP